MSALLLSSIVFCKTSIQMFCFASQSTVSGLGRTDLRPPSSLKCGMASMSRSGMEMISWTSRRTPPMIMKKQYRRSISNYKVSKKGLGSHQKDSHIHVAGFVPLLQLTKLLPKLPRLMELISRHEKRKLRYKEGNRDPFQLREK